MGWSYDTLDEILDYAIRNAICAEMDRDGWDVNVAENWVHWPTTDADIKLPGPDTKGYFSSSLCEDLNGDTISLDPYGRYYGPWRSRIEALFVRWRDIADPAGADALVSKFDAPLEAMTPGGPAPDTSTGTPGTSAADYVGTGEVSSAVDTIWGEMLEMDGDLIDAFTEHYMLPLKDATRAQFLAIAYAQYGVKAQQEIVARMRDDVFTIAVSLGDNMGSASYGGGDGGPGFGEVITVVAALSAAAAFVASGTTAGPAIALVAEGSGVLSGLWDLSGGGSGDTAPVGISPGTPDEVLAAADAALENLDQLVTDAERELQHHLQDLTQRLGAADSPFIVKRLQRLINATDPTKIVSTRELRANPEKLKSIGGTAMPDLADRLRGVTKGFHVGSGPFTRDLTVGINSDGACQEINELLDALRSLLYDQAIDIDDTGDVLAVAGRDLRRTEDQVVATHEALEKQLGRIDARQDRRHPDPVPTPDRPNRYDLQENGFV